MASKSTKSTMDVAPVTAQTISQLPPAEVYEVLGSRPDGLTSTEAAARLGTLGANQLTTRRRIRGWLGPLAVAIRPLLLPLWIAAAIAYWIGAIATAAILAIAALVNTIAGAVQERKTER